MDGCGHFFFNGSISFFVASLTFLSFLLRSSSRNYSSEKKKKSYQISNNSYCIGGIVHILPIYLLEVISSGFTTRTSKRPMESYLAHVLIIGSRIFLQEKELIPHPAPFRTVQLIFAVSRELQGPFLCRETTSPLG